jgi:hypothetical protein
MIRNHFSICFFIVVISLVLSGRPACADSITVIGQDSAGIGLDSTADDTVCQDNTLAVMGGKVGIGTVTPTKQVEVVGSVSATAFYGNGATLSGFGSLAALDSVDTGHLENGSVTEDKLAASLTFDGGDLMNMSGAGVGAGSAGLVLPWGTDVSAAVQEGRISWDSDDDTLYVGNGSSVVKINKSLTIVYYSSSDSESAYVACGSGNPVSGGCKNTGEAPVTTSCPATGADSCTTTNPTGWYCETTTGSGETVTAYVICIAY